MANKSDIEEIVVSVKFKGVEKRVIYNTDKKIAELMQGGKFFDDFVYDLIKSISRDVENLKKGN
jgi:hypothetical protein